MSQSAPSAAPAASTRPDPAGAATTRRQFVNFAFFKLDPAFRRLEPAVRAAAAEEFAAAVEGRREGLICLAYSTVGLRGDVDFMLWRIAFETDLFQAHAAALNKTVLGGYLSTPWSFLSMTKRSIYVDRTDPFHEPESRSRIHPGNRKYLFVYPFVKTRDWYLLGVEERQKIMDVHIQVGNRYPSVKLNTTYSFGLDDQDFVVAFESDEPKDFLDLVMDLRETQSSKFTQRDTPIFTCVRMPIAQTLAQLF